MKLLLSSVKTDCIHSKLALKNLYHVVAGAPLEVTLKEFGMSDTDQCIYEELLREKYNLLYFHCNMINEEKIGHICELVKKAMPSCIIIVGGMQVTFDTHEYMRRHPEVDYVFRGEGEQILFRFISTILTYRFDFEHIDGLAYRENDEILVNRMGEPMKFEDLPFPYDNFEAQEGETVYYESSRGNPDRCHYAQLLPDRKLRSLSLSRVCSELRYFLVKDVREVIFTDKWFNYSRERAYRIWEYLIRNDNGHTSFRFDVNGDLLDEETILMLSEAREGLFFFNVDVESTNAQALDASGRKENIYQLMYNVTKLLQTCKISISVVQRAGLPCETPDLFARAFNKIYGLGADEFRIEVLRLRKGTRLRYEADRYGFRYSRTAPYEVIANDYMPAASLVKIKRIAETLELYAHGFEESIKRILADTGDKPYAFYAGLADFITDNALSRKTGKQENLYRILYTFALQRYDDKDAALKLQILAEIIYSDLGKNASPETIKKFERKGWEIDVASRETH